MERSKLFKLVKSVVVKEYVDWTGETIRSYKQLTKDTQKHGGEGTQSGPSVNTSQNKQSQVVRGGELTKIPKSDAKPVQLQTRQRHDVEYKERNPEVDAADITAKSIFGLDPPSFITKTGKGPEKEIDPTIASGGKTPGAPDFSEKGQGRTTVSKDYVPKELSPAAKEIMAKVEKDANRYEKMTQAKRETKPDTAQSQSPTVTAVSKAIDKTLPQAQNVPEVKPSGETVPEVKPSMQTITPTVAPKTASPSVSDTPKQSTPTPMPTPAAPKMSASDVQKKIGYTTVGQNYSAGATTLANLMREKKEQTDDINDSNLSDIHPSQLAFIKGIGRTESGFRRKEAYSDYLNKASNNANVRRYGDKGADYGYFQTNQLDVQDAIKAGVDPEVAKHLHGGGKGGSSTYEQQVRAMHDYLGKRYGKHYDTLKSGDPKAFENVRSKLQGKWFGLKDNPGSARSEFAKGYSDSDPYKKYAEAQKNKTTQIAQATGGRTDNTGATPPTTPEILKTRTQNVAQNAVEKPQAQQTQVAQAPKPTAQPQQTQVAQADNVSKVAQTISRQNQTAPTTATNPRPEGMMSLGAAPPRPTMPLPMPKPQMIKPVDMSSLSGGVKTQMGIYENFEKFLRNKFLKEIR